MIQMNLGNALAALGERESETARLEGNCSTHPLEEKHLRINEL